MMGFEPRVSAKADRAAGDAYRHSPIASFKKSMFYRIVVTETGNSSE